ncbi:hypothetical protein CGH90_10515 [Vibrio parahaemolyticus]|uniref:hypothetical protein n=1 Tax=Vibrio parahaemolyticus TaxID=670 RepID=UPI00040E6DAD|nr:hypothetical protein [Vibrio parahaemolyticus]TOL82444.1 hypothetical protein CGH90_10515 [Vibrio parahaemolyticus]
MFTLDIELNFTNLEKEVKDFNSHHIRIGVLDKSKTARMADHEKPLKSFQGKQASRVKTGTQGKTNLKMTKLAEYMDTRYRVFSKAESHFQNQDVIRVTNELIRLFNAGSVSPEMIRRIESAARALVRNPIMRKDYGSNARTTIKGGTGYNGYNVQGKGFDWPMVDTGSFFNSIKAQYV